MLGVLISLSIPLLVVSLSVNGVGVGGQQVVGVVDALHEASQAGKIWSAVLYCTVLYYTVLYCTVLSSSKR